MVPNGLHFRISNWFLKSWSWVQKLWKKSMFNIMQRASVPNILHCETATLLQLHMLLYYWVRRFFCTFASYVEWWSKGCRLTGPLERVTNIHIGQNVGKTSPARLLACAGKLRIWLGWISGNRLRCSKPCHQSEASFLPITDLGVSGFQHHQPHRFCCWVLNWTQAFRGRVSKEGQQALLSDSWSQRY